MTEHECPTCERVFDSRRGLGVHHSSVHDEQLPNRVCDNCGKEFYCESARVYCSSECHDESVSYEGKENPNYRGGKETTECDICGTVFEYYPSDKEGLYCTDCVETEQWRPEQDISGSNNPRWNGGKLELGCDVCGERFERYPSNVSGEATLCSNDCRQEWLSEEFTGEGHPNWKGGGNGAYGKGWNEVRQKALERDDYECQICGKSKVEIGRNPDVHHIVPVRVFATADGYEKADAHFLENVVSLCIDCHRKADFGVIPKPALLA